MGGREEAELVLISSLPVSWPFLLFEGQGGVSSGHFLPSVRAAEMHSVIVLCFTSLCSVFSAIALHFLVSQLAEATGCSVLLLHSDILPLVCDWAEGPCEFCTFSFPTPPFHMSAKGDLSKCVHLLLMGDRRCPCTVFFMKLNLTCALRLT